MAVIVQVFTVNNDLSEEEELCEIQSILMTKTSWHTRIQVALPS
jgi:hypothetical protein